MSINAKWRKTHASRLHVLARLTIVFLAGLALSACVAESVPTRSPTPVSDAKIDAATRDALAQKCIGDAEVGTVKANKQDARVAKREDGRWLVSVPIEFEALRTGEQHCVIVDEAGSLTRVGVDSGAESPQGEFERWLAAETLWWE